MITKNLKKVVGLLMFLFGPFAAFAGAVAALGIAEHAAVTGRQVTINYYLENFDVNSITGISIDQDLDSVFGAGNYVIIESPTVDSGSLVANGAYDGSSQTALLSSGSLTSLGTAQLHLIVEINTPVDLGSGLGVYSTQVTGNGTLSGFGAVSDLSQNGTDPDPDGNDDPSDNSDVTPIILFENPIIGVAKQSSLSGNQVTLDFVLENFGNSDLSSLSLPDNLDDVFGTGNYSINAGPALIDDPGTITVNGAYDGSANTDLISSGSLIVSETASIRVVVDITSVTDQGNGLGIYSNQVQVSGTSPGGRVVTDLSDSGNEPDANGDGDPSDAGEDDPTLIVIGEEPAVGIAKTAIVNGTLVTFDYYLENLGNTVLSNMTLGEDLDQVFGTGNWQITSAPNLVVDPGSLTLNESFDGISDTWLLVGQSSGLALAATAQISLTVRITNLSDQGLGTGNYTNQVALTAESPGGTATFDTSDDGTNPDPNGNNNANEAGENDATNFTVGEVAVIGIAKSYVNQGTATLSAQINCVNTSTTGTRLTMFYTVINYGNTTLTNLSVPEDLDSVFGAGNYGVVGDPVVSSGMGTVTANAAYNGSCSQDLIGAGSSLEPGDLLNIEMTLLLVTLSDQGNGLGIYSNQVSASGDGAVSGTVSDLSDNGNDPDPNGNYDPTEAGEDDPTPIIVGSYIGLAKNATVIGNQVTLDFYIESFGTGNLSNLSLTDDLDQTFGAGNYSISSAPALIDDPGTLTLNPLFDGSGDNELLAAGSSLTAADTAQISMEITVLVLTNPTRAAAGLGQYSNGAQIQAELSSGTLIFDLSHAGTDPDPNGNDNPTETTEATPTTFTITTDVVVGAAMDAAISSDQVTIDLYLENFGSATATNLALVHDLDQTFGAGNYSIITPPSLTNDPGTITLNPGFDGSADTELIAAGSTLANSTTATIQMVVQVDPLADQGLGAGVFNSQATVTAENSQGATIIDLSDDGTDPDPSGNGDPTYPGQADPFIASEEDPTLILMNGEGLGIALLTYVQGTIITSDYVVENLGSTSISGIALTHQQISVYGFGNFATSSAPQIIEGPTTVTLNSGFDGLFSPIVFSSGSLQPGEKIRIRAALNITNVTDQGSGFGVYPNQVTISGTSSLGTALTDTSDNGLLTDPNGNGNPGDAGENDQTVSIIGEESIIGISKTATPGAQQVTFDYFIESLGGAALSNLEFKEDLDAVFGAGNYSINSAPALIVDPGTINLNGAYDGSANTDVILTTSTLASGGFAQIQLVVDITTLSDQGLGFGYYQNQVYISGTGPTDSVVADFSDDGTDPDPNGNGIPSDIGESDITTFNFDSAVIGIAKNVATSDNQATIDYTLENLGNVALTVTSVEEDLDDLFGAGNWQIISGPVLTSAPRNLSFNEGYDGSGDIQLIGEGSTISAGLTENFRLVVQVNTYLDKGLGFAIYSTQSQVQAEAPGPVVLTDLSDSGTNPDPNGDGNPDEAGENDPAIFSFVQVPVLGVAETASISTRTVTLNLYLESAGNSPLSNVALVNDLDATFGAGNYSITTAPNLVVDPGTLTLNGAYDGSSDTNLLDGSSTLAIGVTAQIQMVIEVTTVTDQGSGSGIYQNQASVSATSPDATAANDLSDDGTDPDPNGNGVPSDAGENDPTSISLNGNLGDYVWNDLNGDGVQDGGESGLSGITVFLDTNTNGTLDGGESSDITDANGAYSFSDLAAGSYTVAIDGSTLPSGFVLITANLPLSVSLSAGENKTDADFGYQQQDASIGDFVWNDLNGDGVQDGGEPGLSGITVYLDANANGTLDGGEASDVTDANGAYDFTALPTGSYTLAIDASTVTAGFVLITANLPLVVNLAAGEDFNNGDFGYQQQDATIGDFVWNDLNGDGVQDGGEPGISGITVYLDANANGTLDGGEASDVTDGNGAYDFTALPAGTYNLAIDASTLTAGFVLITANLPLAVNLAAGEDFNDGDFGYQQQDASIGDFVWNDLNGDGVQDGGEPGLSGVTVFLDANTNGLLDGGEINDTTDANGAYDLTNLATGSYSVVVDTSTLPSGFVLTGSTQPLAVNLAAGEDYNSADFGYQQQDASIGDFVWNDLNGDGMQDGGEPGLASVVVFLDLNTNGTLDGGEPSDTTDANGAYDLTNLATGTYSVRVDSTSVPAGFVLITTNPLSISLAAGEDYNDADFGYQQQDASIGDLVWNDLNGDGIVDGGEPGLSGITVWLDLNTNGSLDGGEPSASTDGNGAFDFTSLPTGTYSVQVDVSTIPVGFVLITANIPQSVNLAAGEDFNDADFGFQQQDATIGDFAWDDLDGNGVLDGGEPALSGLTFYLDLNSNGSKDVGEPEETTDGGGAYDFSALPTGTYLLSLDAATLPAGYRQTAGTTLPLTVNLAAGEDFNDGDFGFQVQDASIGDLVSNDLNGNGVINAVDLGLAGVTIYLDLNDNGSLDGGEPSAVTDANGAYDITDLAPGTYKVRAITPSGFVLTSANIPLTVVLSTSEDYNDADFLFQQQDASIGDLVWNDSNADGIADPGEPGYENVTLEIYILEGGAPDGPPIAFATTDADGIYHFSGLPPGGYLVKLTDLNNVLAGLGQTNGFPFKPASITPGLNDDTVDFGFCGAPTIKVQPVDQMGCNTGSVSFEISASGPNLQYQWRVDGFEIPGANDSMLTINPVSLADEGLYDCVVSSTCGTTISDSANLTLDVLSVSLPTSIVQGLDPVTLTATISCEGPNVTWEWQDLLTGVYFGIDENPVTLDSLLPSTRSYEIIVMDDVNPPVGANITVLVPVDDDYVDFNKDGCNSDLDLFQVMEYWQAEGISDPNGDLYFDIRDFLYIKTGARCPGDQ